MKLNFIQKRYFLTALVVLSLFSIQSANAQATNGVTGDYRAVTTGNWSNAAIWQTCNTANGLCGFGTAGTVGTGWSAAASAPNGTTTQEVRINSNVTVTVDASTSASKMFIFGTLNIDANQTLTINGGNVSINSTAVRTHNIQGTLALGANTFHTNNSTSASVINNSGTIQSAADMNIGCTFNNTNLIEKTGGVLNVNAGSVFTNSLTGTIDKKSSASFFTLAGSLINHGTIKNDAGNFNVNGNTGSLTNEATGTITKSVANFNIGQTAAPASTGSFTNKGTFTNVSGNFTCFPGSTLVNNGSISRTAGTFAFSGNTSGTGSFTGTTLDYTNALGGSVSPGNSTGTIALGRNFVNSGTINIEINGAADFDKITTTGTTNVGNTIAVTFPGTFRPSLNQTFAIVAGGGAATAGATVSTPVGYAATYTVSTTNVNNGILTFTQTLPIELTKFEAKAGKNTTNLAWVTASEKDNAQFEVQHATNGIDFQTISTIKGRGTTSAETVYNHEHNTPSVGVNYYRLKQTDFDGKTDFSPVRSVVFGKDKFAVKTTLVQNQLTVMASGEQAANLQIFNVSGLQVLNVKVQGEQMIDVSNLPSGMYIVRMASETARFVKQ